MDGVTLLVADTMNDLNRLQYTILGDPTTIADLRTTVLPFSDATALIAGSADATKKLRFEVDGITTATTRVVAVPDRDITLGGITLVAPVATTSGTSIDFTGIPAGVKRITIMPNEVSLAAGTDKMQIQIGDSGGIETTGYLSAASLNQNATSPTVLVSTNGFIFHIGGGGNIAISGVITLTLQDAATNTWCFSSTVGNTSSGVSTGVIMGGGRKALSATFDRFRLTTIVGSEAFDAGSMGYSYE